MTVSINAGSSWVKTLGRGSATLGLTISIAVLATLAWFALMVALASSVRPPEPFFYDLPVFVAGWIIMLTAMMLPSELHYIGALGMLLRGRGKPLSSRHGYVWAFIGGYFAVWTAYGICAFALNTAICLTGPRLLAWRSIAPVLAGTVLLGAAVFQITPLKQACLKGCRSPLSFFARHWRDGHHGAMVMGMKHGLVCVGCCWGLMAVMFAVGSMSLVWMALLTVIMFAEKALPVGGKLTKPVGVLLALFGLWVLISPDTAPLMKRPLMYGTSLCLG